MYVENESKHNTSNNTTYAVVLHLSSFAGYVFPFGNIILPVVLWLVKKDESHFIDVSGKSTINFEISLMLYTLILAILIIPITIFTLGMGLVALLIAALPLLIAYIVVKIQAAIQASNGRYYQYPFTIEFIK